MAQRISAGMRERCRAQASAPGAGAEAGREGVKGSLGWRTSRAELQQVFARGIRAFPGYERAGAGAPWALVVVAEVCKLEGRWGKRGKCYF